MNGFSMFEDSDVHGTSWLIKTDGNGISRFDAADGYGISLYV